MDLFIVLICEIFLSLFTKCVIQKKHNHDAQGFQILINGTKMLDTIQRIFNDKTKI